MFALVAELLFWIIWDFVLSFIFYFTGAMLLYVFSIGRINYSLSPARFLSRPRVRGRSETDKPFLLGFVFYVGLFVLAIYLS